MGTLVIIALVASLSYKSPVDVSDINSHAKAVALSDTSAAIADVANPSIDEISAANLAAKVADTANLTVSTDVLSQYITLNAKSELAQSDESVIAKPQVFDVAQSRTFETYTPVVGDTVTALAAKYGLTADTIRWANNLTTDAVTPGKELVIPPVDGVVYTARDGDTAESIAAKYKSDAARIVSQNDLELHGLSAGTRVIVPGGVLPESERPGYVAPRTVYTTPVVTSTQLYNSDYTVQAGNRYSYGYCTWYAYNRRAELGRPVGSLWGNAATWAYAATAAGYRVDHTPEAGAVMQHGGGLGHVGVVEQVYDDGSYRISEMNYAGWNVVSSRTLSAADALNNNFIH